MQAEESLIENRDVRMCLRALGYMLKSNPGTLLRCSGYIGEDGRTVKTYDMSYVTAEGLSIVAAFKVGRHDREFPSLHQGSWFVKLHVESTNIEVGKRIITMKKDVARMLWSAIGQKQFAFPNECVCKIWKENSPDNFYITSPGSVFQISLDGFGSAGLDGSSSAGKASCMLNACWSRELAFAMDNSILDRSYHGTFSVVTARHVYIRVKKGDARQILYGKYKGACSCSEFWQGHLLAFALGMHARLGQSSIVHCIDMYLFHVIAAQVLCNDAGLAPGCA
jgi:hypothetical protein